MRNKQVDIDLKASDIVIILTTVISAIGTILVKMQANRLEEDTKHVKEHQEVIKEVVTVVKKDQDVIKDKVAEVHTETNSKLTLITDKLAMSESKLAAALEVIEEAKMTRTILAQEAARALERTADSTGQIVTAIQEQSKPIPVVIENADPVPVTQTDKPLVTLG